MAPLVITNKGILQGSMIKRHVHVFSKQTIHNMLLRFLIVIMKHATKASDTL